MKAITTLASLALATASTNAAIVWSGIVDIDIPGGLDGVYINIGTGDFQTAADDSFAVTDLNFYTGGFALRSSGDFLPARTGILGTDAIVNLALGSEVDSSLSFAPAGVGVSNTHMGTGSGQFEAGQEGYLGFIFAENGGPEYYGWMRATLTNNGIGSVHEWAFENSSSGAPITVGAVPEPSTALLVVLGCAGLFRRRR